MGTCGGYQLLMGGSPMAGWFIESPNRTLGWWLGIALWLRKPPCGFLPENGQKASPETLAPWRPLGGTMMRITENPWEFGEPWWTHVHTNPLVIQIHVFVFQTGEWWIVVVYVFCESGRCEKKYVICWSVYCFSIFFSTQIQPSYNHHITII